MCGRFTQAQIRELDREVFKLLNVPELEPRYNVAPTQDVAVIREGDGEGRRISLLRWGLIPSWANDPGIGNRLINARAESLTAKPSFRDAFERRRCLVPADGFYEWQKTARGKRPMYVRPAGGGVFALAGLWERWAGPGTGPVETFTIVTTEPNERLAPIHDRMPAILSAGQYDRWLDPANHDTRELERLLGPYPSDRMEVYPVGSYVNDPKNDGPTCIEPVEEAPC